MTVITQTIHNGEEEIIRPALGNKQHKGQQSFRCNEQDVTAK